MTTRSLDEFRPGRRVLVRNRRNPRRWRWTAGVVRFLTLVSIVFLVRGFDWPYLYLVIGLAYAAIEVYLSFFGPAVLRWNCLDWIVFADALETSPHKPKTPAASVVRIEFAPDASEDYDESGNTYCELAVVLGPRVRWRMLIEVEDATRVKDWAAEKRVAVVDSPEPTGPLSRRRPE